MKDEMLSVVIPMYCEEEVIPALYERLSRALEQTRMRAEIIFVDDGSEDRTAEELRALAASDPRVKVVELSKNFGLAAAVTAGLDRARGDAVVLMDGDLQDPPELIPELVARWRQGYQVVNAVKGRRPEHLPKRIAFRGFYALLGGLTELNLPMGCGLFSLMDRRVVRELLLMREQHRFVAGLRWWVGFRQCCITFDREKRYDGKPRQSLGKLVRLGLDAIFSFSSRPLTLALWLGFAISLLCLAGSATIVYIKLFTEAAIPGWTSNMVTTLFIGAVQLIMLGIVGQYIGRIYDEIKRRPLYIVKSITSGAAKGQKDEGSRDPDTPGARADTLVVPGAQARDTGAAAAIRESPEGIPAGGGLRHGRQP